MAAKNPTVNDKIPQQHKVGKEMDDTCTDEVRSAVWRADAARKVDPTKTVGQMPTRSLEGKLHHSQITQ